MGGGHHAAAAAPTGAAPLPNRHKWVTPYTGHKVYQGHPKWLQALEAMPRGKAISGAFGATFVVAGLFWSIAMARGEHVHTLSNDWKAANKEFMKFQKMNPIFGISSKGH